MEPGPEGRAAYYGKWDNFATDEERVTADEEKRLAEEAATKLGLDPAKPVCQGQAEETARRQALRDAKKQWEAHKDREFQAKAWIEDEEGERRTLEPSVLDMKEVIHLRGCSKGEYTLPAAATVAKIFVENCKDCTFVIHGRVITGHIEVWNCETLSIDVASQLGTLQMDSCKGVRVRYSDKECVGSWVHADSSALSVHFGDGTEAVEDLYAGVEGVEAAAADVQFITRWVAGVLLTERIVRDSTEYPTTERELREQGRAAELEPAAIAKRADIKKDQGNAAFKEGSWAQAVVFYTQGITVLPSAALHSNRAAAFLKLGEHQKALDDANAALGLEPDNVKAMFRKGLALHALARYGEAVSILDKASALDPKNQQVKDAVRMAEYKARMTAKGAAAC